MYIYFSFPSLFLPIPSHFSLWNWNLHLLYIHRFIFHRILFILFFFQQLPLLVFFTNLTIETFYPVQTLIQNWKLSELPFFFSFFLSQLLLNFPSSKYRYRPHTFFLQEENSEQKWQYILYIPDFPRLFNQMAHN